MRSGSEKLRFSFASKRMPILQQKEPEEALQTHTYQDLGSPTLWMWISPSM